MFQTQKQSPEAIIPRNSRLPATTGCSMLSSGNDGWSKTKNTAMVSSPYANTLRVMKTVLYFPHMRFIISW